MENEGLNFWGHLEALRWTLMRIVIAVFILVIAFFVTMPSIFQPVILGASSSDFILYRLLCKLNDYIYILPQFCNESFHIRIVNINLSSQFLTHISSSFYLGIIFSFPYIVWELWRFVSPALYESEKKGIRSSFLLGGFLFYLGILVGYLFIFPITLRFLAGYEISSTIENQISLDSYMGNFNFMIFAMGIVFELPILILALAKLGIVSKTTLKDKRRYVIVGLLVLAAIITPTGDPFTLLFVFAPLYFLYELSIRFVKENKKRDEI